MSSFPTFLSNIGFQSKRDRWDSGTGIRKPAEFLEFFMSHFSAKCRGGGTVGQASGDLSHSSASFGAS